MMIAEQVALMATICGIYGIDVGKDGLKMLATTAIGAGGATIVGKTIATNLFKLDTGGRNRCRRCYFGRNSRRRNPGNGKSIYKSLSNGKAWKTERSRDYVLQRSCSYENRV